MAVIAWSNTSPADSVQFTSMASRIQSVWTSIATGLNESIYWQDGSANSDGEFKTETMRLATVPGTSARSLAAADGYLIMETAEGNVEAGLTSDSCYHGGGLYHAGSSDTFCCGSAFMQEHATDVMTAPISARWVVRSGTIESIDLDHSAPSTSVITFGETYSDASEVRVFVTVADDADNSFIIATGDDIFIGIQRISKETAESVISYAANAAAYPDRGSDATTVNLMWISEGTVSYG